MSENRLLGALTASSIKNFFPKSVSNSQKMNLSRRKSRYNTENVPPADPNIQIGDPPLPPSISFPKKSPLKPAEASHKEVTISGVQQVQAPPLPDPPVKVVVRIRPASGGDRTVRKVADDAISVGERKFTFDSILDLNSNQDDVFQSVGVPLVKNALAGYNTSILAYGQSGSGKSYTMWGPPSAMVEIPSADGPQGIVPRIVHMLFSDIQKEQENSEGKQINYQCRCSFLEIYNDQIGDLLDPAQRNLELKDDAKSGFYVENLTEEYVTSYEDVTQILIKGLSSRKVGASSNNSKSSRSHIVFTCMIESWCKESSSKCFGRSKTSRISLIDLAGFEKNIIDDSGKQCAKEGKFVKKSTSQLGHLVNLLVNRSEPDDPEPVPYRSSCLTHLLKESLGGNAKLSVICAISSDNKCIGETISTLRFGQRAKLVQNKPVINEITEDDVSDLSDRIRELKEELIRAKSDTSSSTDGQCHFRSRSARESLNQLRLSINRSLILPRIDSDSQEELKINEDDIKELQLQIDNLQGTWGENSKETSRNTDCVRFLSAEGCETDLTCEHYMSCSEVSDDEEEINSEAAQAAHVLKPRSIASKPSISISSQHQFTILQEPMLSESPKIKSTQRKSMTLSPNQVSQQDETQEIYRSLELSQKPSVQIRSSLRSSRVFSGPTESLAASLHRGLQIIDYHQKNSLANRSSVSCSAESFSFGHLALKSSASAEKANAAVQTLSIKAPSAPFLCVNCQKTGLAASEDVQPVQDSLNKWIVPLNDEECNKNLVQATKRELELETLCKEQEAKIEQLNLMLAQFKKELEQKAIIECDEAPKPDENKLLMWSASNNLMKELVKEKCEIHEVLDDMHPVEENKAFDTNVRLKEIETLENKLRFHTDGPANKSIDKLRSSLLSQSIQFRKSRAFAQGLSEEELEKERERWTEMESEWISLTDELRLDIEFHRERAEKVEMELRLEKKVTEELDDVVKRSVLGQARMIEHYAELQDKYNDLAAKHRSIMEAVADIKKAASKAGAKGHGSRFQKAMAKELSAMRVERERERELLRKENRSLKLQLKETAEAVHAAGEILVRLREAEETAKVAEEKFANMQEENEKLKKQMEKVKRKHKMEMVTMKQYLAESRLPEAALQPPLYREDSEVAHNGMDSLPYDDQAWKAEFGAIYQEQL